jgi:hypothetical protein
MTKKMKNEKTEIKRLKETIEKLTGRINVLLILLVITCFIIFIWSFVFYGLNAEAEFYKEYSKVLCETTNEGIDFINNIYPEWVEYKCEDLYLVLDNSEKADILCKGVNKSTKLDKLDCGEIK